MRDLDQVAVRTLHIIRTQARRRLAAMIGRGMAPYGLRSPDRSIAADPILDWTREMVDVVVDIGETWAYRARNVDQLVEVLVLRIGTNKPARVMVRFVADEFEGREEWVPPARLKVPWCGVAHFAAREHRWAAVTDASCISDTAEDYATGAVFDALIDKSLASIGYGGHAGVTTIQDVDGLTRFLDVDPGQLLTDPLSFVELGALVVPWSITQLIAQRAAEREPDRILRDVEKNEADHERDTTYGKTYPASRKKPAWRVDAEHYVEMENEPYNRPCWDLLRRWCGVEAATRRDELLELRREVARLGNLTLQAIATLRAAGQTREADRIERELGVTVEDLRA
ncbi:MAG: hypothetical protein LC797_09090 [Chloroflexi bacterium]|nr:hypothetical protein [Chloroflexota bacterium]